MPPGVDGFGGNGKLTGVLRARLPLAARGLGVRQVGALVLRETLLVAVAYTVYQWISDAAPRRRGPAVHHLRELLGLEQALHVDVERSVNTWWVGHHTLLVAGNWYYAVMHFAVPALALFLLLLRAPRVYARLRSALIAATVAGLAVFWLWPVAPPRLLPHGGYVDAVAMLPTLGGGPYDGPYGTVGENPYAAVPSLHVAWALWAAVAVWALTRRALPRLLAGGHVLLTVVIIVATANHLLVDAVAGAAVTALGVAAAAALSPAQSALAALRTSADPGRA